MSIPVYINVRNRLTTTKALADEVACLPGAVPILIDNASDWGPLLEWYESCDYEVIRLPLNGGHHAPWRYVVPKLSAFRRIYGQDTYAVTDCDLDIGECPMDLLEVLREPFAWGEGIVKSGVSLRIDDLPTWQGQVLEWESRWWLSPIHDGRFYRAAIDTTFAAYQAHTPHRLATRVTGIKSVRSAPPYIAKHIPWYLNAEYLDAENAHYFATANASNSWKPDGKGMRSTYNLITR